jgi:hypothetical protein
MRVSMFSQTGSIPFKNDTYSNKEKTYGTVTDYGFKPVPHTREEALEYLERSEEWESLSKVLSASKPRQSSPEELVYHFLEGEKPNAAETAMGIPVYPNVKAFNREVIDVEDGKEIRAFFIKGGKRVEVYAFKVLGGEFGDSTGSTLVNLLPELDGVNPWKSENVEVRAQEDWTAPEDYYNAPSSHDNYRISSGGGSVFEDEEAEAISSVYEMVENNDLENKICEWYPDHTKVCGKPATIAKSSDYPHSAFLCADCALLREKRDNTAYEETTNG